MSKLDRLSPSMNKAAPEYAQTGLPTPYPHAFTKPQSEDSPANPAFAQRYPPQQEERANTTYPATAAAAASSSSSEYGVYQSSFADHVQRQQQPAITHAGSTSSAVMAPPFNPSIAAPSPTYPFQSARHSPHPPQQDLQHRYRGRAGGAIYSQPALTGQATAATTSTACSVTLSQARRPPNAMLPLVYSFVPITGAQQHKRPRRRYEEIERIYKCGWNGCEKAYGTLTHLNGHIAMQSRGTKCNPEEFKEIRREWKARKEENQRNADDGGVRIFTSSTDLQAASNPAPTLGSYQQQPGRSVQLPPIRYQPSTPVPGHYPGTAGDVQQPQVYSNSAYLAPPHGARNQMYSQG